MKLATLRNGTRDGHLVVVSRDLAHCTSARLVAPTLQAALDDWARAGPGLQELAEGLARGAVPAERFHERERRLNERLESLRARPYSFHVANIFPNFALIGVGSAFYGKGLILHLPRGANRTEVWVWCAVERNAPETVKRQQRFVLMQRQAAAGLVAPDDHEIFERISETIDSGMARQAPFHYEMAAGRDDEDPRPPDARDQPWPGKVGPQISEINQRDFYRYWNSLMEAGK